MAEDSTGMPATRSEAKEDLVFLTSGAKEKLSKTINPSAKGEFQRKSAAKSPRALGGQWFWVSLLRFKGCVDDVKKISFSL
ncbi:hypothetical protein R1flu_019627 [Riccia fluitans]|uniref:Uncharacterized protein n=1 Tax=Riccia fluitans TaxID=41844 RepID=A0ABD1ZN08_9MARC